MTPYPYRTVSVDNAMALMRDACRLIQLVNGEGLEDFRAAIHAPNYQSHRLSWIRAAHDHFDCCPETVALYGEVVASAVGKQFLASRERLWPDLIEAAKFMLKRNPEPGFFAKNRTTPLGAAPTPKPRTV